MSIALMTLAWKSDYPTGKKMILLALCDNANDQGECYPSVSMLAKKCSMSERSVFNHINDLEQDGAIRRENRNGRSTVYHLDPCKFCTPATVAPLQPLHPTPATVAPPPLQRLHPTPATVAPINIREPSIEPSGNQIPTPDGVSDQVWRDFKTLRKEKKTKLTQTALDGISREAASAGWTLEQALAECCSRGWVGFKADWVRQSKARPAAAESFREREQRQARERWEEMTGRRHPDNQRADVPDAEPRASPLAAAMPAAAHAAAPTEPTVRQAHTETTQQTAIETTA